MTASTIRVHVETRHPDIRPVPRATEDVQREHARSHHRRHLSHTHEEDNAGNLIGPGSDRRRPSGWTTGLHVIERPSMKLARRETTP